MRDTLSRRVIWGHCERATCWICSIRPSTVGAILRRIGQTDGSPSKSRASEQDDSAGRLGQHRSNRLMGMVLHSAPCPRLLPERSFPPYAYLPGRFPHPIRHPEGHSYGVEPGLTVAVAEALRSDEFRWGIDLFNFGYYWEAHEAWEALWQASRAAPDQRSFLHALILFCAAGVKLREGKGVPAVRHARRGASLLRGLRKHHAFEAAIGHSLDDIADCVEADALAGSRHDSSASPVPRAVFQFTIVPDHVS